MPFYNLLLYTGVYTLWKDFYRERKKTTYFYNDRYYALRHGRLLRFSRHENAEHRRPCSRRRAFRKGVLMPAGMRSCPQRDIHGTVPAFECEYYKLYALGRKRENDRRIRTGKGIHSAYIGKWHLDGGDYFGDGICPAGYDSDYWYDMRCYLDEMTADERRFSRDENASLKGIDAEFTFAHRCTDKALSFLEKYQNDDFFLTVSFDEPHQPYLCPEPYASMYKDYEMPKKPNFYDTLEGKPEYQKLWAKEHLHENKDDIHIRPRLFLGCNSFADYEIGRITAAAKSSHPTQ